MSEQKQTAREVATEKEQPPPLYALIGAILVIGGTIGVLALVMMPETQDGPTMYVGNRDLPITALIGPAVLAVAVFVGVAARNWVGEST